MKIPYLYHKNFENYLIYKNILNCFFITISILTSNIIYSQENKKINDKSLEFFKDFDKLINEKQDVTNAEKELNKLITSSEYDKNLFEGDYLYRLGIINFMKNDYKKSIENSNNAITIFKEKKKINKIGRAERNIGEAYLALNNKKDALTHFHNSEKLIDKKAIHFIYNALSELYFKLNDNRTALKYAFKSKEILDINKDENSLIALFNNLGNIYNKEKNINKSLKYYNESLKLSKKRKFDYYIYYSTNAIGTVYLNFNNYNKALENFIKAESYLKKNIIKNNEESLLKYNLSKCYFHLKKIELSEKELEKCYAIVKQKKDYLLETKYTILKGKIQLVKRNNESALICFNNAIQLASKNNFLTELAESYFELYKYFKNKETKSEALDFFTKFHDTQKIIDDKKKKDNIEEIQIRYEVANYKQSLDMKNQEIELLTLKNNQTKYQIFLFIAIILSLIMYVYKQYKTLEIRKKNELFIKEISELKEEKLINEIKFKNNQVTEFALQIQEQNNLLNQLKLKINKIKKQNNNQQTIEEFNNLHFIISEAIHINNEKVELNKEIKNNQESFLFNLRNKFPELTEKEIQIATYLRLNFNTKQISSQLNISEKSTNNYRTLIRKKLGLEKNENLSQFLKEI